MTMKAQNAMPAPKPPKNKEELWDVIQHLNDFTLPQLLHKEGVSLQTIRRQVASLVKGGFLREEAIRQTGVNKRYHVVNANFKDPRKEPNGRQRMWMGMKAKKTFDFREVALFSRVPLEAARLYCYALRKAGYLAVKKPATANGTPELYQFDTRQDTGLYAPQIRRDKSVYDRNTQKVVWQPESEGA